MSERELLAEALDHHRSMLNAGWDDRLSAIYEAATERLAQLPPYSDELVERIGAAIRYGWGENVVGDGPRIAVTVLKVLNEETP